MPRISGLFEVSLKPLEMGDDLASQLIAECRSTSSTTAISRPPARGRC